MSPLEPSYPTTERPEYSDVGKEQENDLKDNFMKMIVLKEQIKKSLKEMEERTTK